MFRVFLLVLIGSATLASTSAWAQGCEAHAQATYVRQFKQALDAAYSGAHSLTTDKEASYSFTATAFLGCRLFDSTEVYFNPEAAQGVPLSELQGLGGLTNGEMARSSGPILKAYVGRLFVRQTWQLDGERQVVESAANQLAGEQSDHRVVFTVGRLTLQDLFDNNSLSHDPRTQFLNWSLMTFGAYDYAGDTRGYSEGAAIEYFAGPWAVRYARFAQPQQPNEQQLGYDLLHHYGDQYELEHHHTLGDQAGVVRVLAFVNRARMARYVDALAVGGVPDVNAVRDDDHIKHGWGVGVEQAVADDLGVFARGSWADGQTEVYAFTEIDRSMQAGAVLKGTRWHRPDDAIGLAWANNALSSAHRDYLAAGGLGYFIGDGQLTYRNEQVVEAYYALALWRGVSLSLDGQYVSHPAYNADRGPARFVALRLHAEL